MIYEETVVFVFKLGFLEGFSAAKRKLEYDKASEELEEKLRRADLVKLLSLPEYERKI